MAAETKRRLLKDDAEFGKYVHEKLLEHANRISPGVYGHPIAVALAFEVTLDAPIGKAEKAKSGDCVCHWECHAAGDGGTNCISVCKGTGKGCR
jgi:hypothetical protein